MTALELMERLNGEIVMNRVRVTVDGKLTVVAILNGTEWEPTAEGTELMNVHSHVVVEDAKPVKPAKASKAKQAQVESVESQPEQEPQAEAPVESTPAAE